MPAIVLHGTYDKSMSVLPLCVRLSLWVTAAYAGQLTLEDAVHRAHPDLDPVTGDLDRLSLWRDLGERAVLVALPRPGNLSGTPRGSADFIAAATGAGECIYVPGIGGALVPRIEHFGPADDQGTRVTWTAYDCEPMPVHTLEALSLSEIEQGFRHELMERTRAIEDLDAGPIIEQDVVRVSHRDQLADLIQRGRDLEKVVLSRAVRWHIEHRILVYGKKTVIFD